MNLAPVVSSFEISGNVSASSHIVTLNNTVVDSTPTKYRASESSSFSGAVWLPYSQAPSFTLRSTPGAKIVYFQVMDGSGKKSAIVSDNIRGVWLARNGNPGMHAIQGPAQCCQLKG
jgi:hypothetical protein